MGMTKKLYMDWCEQNDINPELELSQDMAWTAEFEQWLDKLSSSSPLGENEMRQLELDLSNTPQQLNRR
jgi:hypothetical protein